MAQFNSAKKVNSNNEPVIESTDVMTGDKNQSRFLYYQIKMSMLRRKESILLYRSLWNPASD